MQTNANCKGGRPHLLFPAATIMIGNAIQLLPNAGPLRSGAPRWLLVNGNATRGHH